MKRFLLLFFSISVSLWSAACNNSSSPGTVAQGIVVNVSGSFATISVGGAPVTLTATLTGNSGNSGLTWTLSVANTGCSPACGTLKPSDSPSLTAVYTPPATLPVNQTATITARSLADSTQIFVFNFQILPPIVVSITNKFTSQTAGGPVTDISATITNDANNAGLSWTLTAGGSNCSPVCGDLTADPAPALTSHYTPPAVPPSGANASPTITAASVADPTQKDSFNFTIVAPPISVTIANKFSSQAVGGPPISVNATIVSDFSNAGLTWSLVAAGAACSPACGTLVPAAAPSLTAAYTPPSSVPPGAAASPTITATSVADPTKSDSFSFTIATAASALSGRYAFLLRGYDPTGTAPLAIAGAFIADGAGTITDAEFEINNGGTMVSFPSPLAGSYSIDTSFNGIPRVSITIASSPINLVLKCSLSSDGKRGQIIQLDNSGYLTSGTLLQQDPAALTADPAGNYAFGVESDSPAGQRIVEAGQFILGAGGTSITGGLADAAQFTSAVAIIGGINGGAPISAGSATAPDTFGRGTLTLTVPSASGSPATYSSSYAYYVVNSQQLNLLEINSAAPLQSILVGSAQRQKVLDANSVNSTGVVALTGLTTVGSAPSSDVVIGVFAVTGGNSSTANYDVNRGGTVDLSQNTFGSVFPALANSAFDPTTGRVVFVNQGGQTATNFVGVAALYYYDIGKAFLIDITPDNGAGALSHALLGSLIPQAAGPFSLDSALSGNAIVRSGGSSIGSIPNLDFAATFDSSISPGSYTAAADLTTSNTAIGSSGQVAGVPLSGQYLLDDVNLGRGRMSFTGGVFGNFSASSADVAIYYLIGPNQFVAIEASGFGPSGIIFFDPQ